MSFSIPTKKIIQKAFSYGERKKDQGRGSEMAETRILFSTKLTLRPIYVRTPTYSYLCLQTYT